MVVARQYDSYTFGQLLVELRCSTGIVFFICIFSSSLTSSICCFLFFVFCLFVKVGLKTREQVIDFLVCREMGLESPAGMQVSWKRHKGSTDSFV